IGGPCNPIQQDGSNNTANLLIQEIVDKYPVSLVERGLDASGQQLTGSISDNIHGNVLANLLQALQAIDNKFVSLGTSLSHVFGANQIAIALDYYGLNGAFSGITPYDIPNRMRLGNSMSAEHIV